jgi:hypothetical protein
MTITLRRPETPIVDTDFASKMKQSYLHEQEQQQHPDLDDLYFIDNLTGERIYPNAEPVHIDNELYSGKLLIMIRTSDADQHVEPEITGGSKSNDIVSNYFRSKKRRFEIQLQVKFKKVPDSQTFLAIEYNDPVKLSLIPRNLLSAALHFCKMKNPTFSHSLSGKEKVSEEDMKQGKYENPHFAFPIETSMDVIVTTKAGDVPPKLGGKIYEDPERKKKRMKGEGIVYNTEDTYTLCIWDSHVDFVQWKAINLPAIPKFSLTRMNDAQPLSVKMYMLNSNDENHFQKDLHTIVDIEICHKEITSLGSGTQRYIDRSVRNCTDQEASTSAVSIVTSEEKLLEMGEIIREEKRKKKKCCCISPW